MQPNFLRIYERAVKRSMRSSNIAATFAPFAVKLVSIPANQR